MPARDPEPPCTAPALDGGIVGRGMPTYVIAEIGVNHDGHLDSALDLVNAAAEAGADAVKFQLFRTSELVTQSAATAAYQQRECRAETQHALLSKLELSNGEFRIIRRRCRELGIGFIGTPFDHGSLELLAELSPAAIKIASPDLSHHALTSAAARLGVPLIVSVGAATDNEIAAALEHLRPQTANTGLIVLHCVSCYPTPIAAINLRAIAAISERFHVPTGLSDHTQETETGGLAVACGAVVLEKHVTLDRACSGPDHRFSLEPADFRRYVALARLAEQAMGTGRIGMTPIEDDVRTAARRSIVARQDIPAGTVVRSDMVALKRPGTGISPAELPNVLDKTTTRPIAADTPLAWDMLA